MKYFKVMIDYKNFIPIDDTELEKALRTLASDGKAFFKEGATEKVHAVLPDYHRIMGWNYGYELQPEDYALIGKSKDCNDAKNLIYSTKESIAGREMPPELQNDIKKLSDGMKA